MFICSPPEVNSMRLRMIEVMLSPMYGAKRFSRTHSRFTPFVNLMSLLLVWMVVTAIGLILSDAVRSTKNPPVRRVGHQVMGGGLSVGVPPEPLVRNVAVIGGNVRRRIGRPGQGWR